MLTHRGFSAWVASNGKLLPEYLIAVDEQSHRVSCWIPGVEGHVRSALKSQVARSWIRSIDFRHLLAGSWRKGGLLCIHYTWWVRCTGEISLRTGDHFTRRRTGIQVDRAAVHVSKSTGKWYVPGLFLFLGVILISILSNWISSSSWQGSRYDYLENKTYSKSLQSTIKCHPTLTSRSRQASSRRSLYWVRTYLNLVHGVVGLTDMCLDSGKKWPRSNNMSQRGRWFLMIKTALELPNQGHTFLLFLDIAHQVFLASICRSDTRFNRLYRFFGSSRDFYWQAICSQANSLHPSNI